MREVDDCQCDEDSLLFDREELAVWIGLILDGDPRAADVLARLLDTFRHAIDGGLRGINTARRGLVTAVELTYLRTGTHASALKLYHLSLEGELRGEDEPLTLINAALGRSTAGARAHGTQGRTRVRSSRQALR
jgi:hypothetical protein